MLMTLLNPGVPCSLQPPPAGVLWALQVALLDRIWGSPRLLSFLLVHGSPESLLASAKHRTGVAKAACLCSQACLLPFRLSGLSLAPSLLFSMFQKTHWDEGEAPSRWHLQQNDTVPRIPLRDSHFLVSLLLWYGWVWGQVRATKQFSATSQKN